MGTRLTCMKEDRMIIWAYQGYLYERETPAIHALTRAVRGIASLDRSLVINMSGLRYLFPKDVLLLSRAIEFAFADHVQLAYVVNPKVHPTMETVGKLYELRGIDALYTSEGDARRALLASRAHTSRSSTATRGSSDATALAGF